jgi:hypothetical protein
MHVQKELVKYKMQVRDLEEQLAETQRDFDTKIAIQTARQNNNFKDQRIDYEQNIRDLKTMIRSLQIELDVERNQ